MRGSRTSDRPAHARSRPRAAVGYAESREAMQCVSREEQMARSRRRRRVRRDIVTMIDARPARPHRRRPLGHGHPRHAVRRGARRRSRAPGSPRPRPLHPEQGPLRRRAVRHAGALRLLPAARAGHVHGAAVAAQRPPEPQQGAGRRDEHRPARPRLPGRRRMRARGQAPRRIAGARSSSSATASCRKAATGRRR